MKTSNRSLAKCCAIHDLVLLPRAAALVLVFASTVFLVVPLTHAAPSQAWWDSSGTATSQGTCIDGPGTWSASAPYWWVSGVDSGWMSGNIAEFGVGLPASNPYTVNVSGNVTAGGVYFNNQAYTLSGGTLTLNNTSSAYSSPDFYVATGVSGTISNSTITKTAANATTYVGGSAASSGTLTLTGGSGAFNGSRGLEIDNATVVVGAGENILAVNGGIEMGSGNTGNGGYYDQTGGTVITNEIYVGNGSPASFTVGGGVFASTSTTTYFGSHASYTVNFSGGTAVLDGFKTAGFNPNLSGTLSLSAGSLDVVGAVNMGVYPNAQTTFNVTGGSATMAGALILSYTTGDRTFVNMSGGQVVANSGYLEFENGALANTAVINQSGGVFDQTASGFLMGWEYNSTGYNYSAYQLSGGSFYSSGGKISVGNQYHTLSLFSQSGGTATMAGAFYLGLTMSAGQAVGDISGGFMTVAGNVMYTGDAASYAGGTDVLNVRNNGYFQSTGASGSFIVTDAATATGIVNDTTGGTLEASRIYQSGGSSTINFDGGTLRAYTGANANFLSGLTNAFVYPGGLTFDTNAQKVTVGQSLTAPTGYGIGTTGSTIPVASGGGAGYLAPPIVTFAAPTSGVAATGVATLTNGVVTGITITSPGEGYTNGQAVAVTFNASDNSSSAATTMASGFNVSANDQLSGGSLGVIGGGSLYLNGANALTGITVAGGASLGGTGSTTSGVNVANGGGIDLSQNGGHAFNVAGNLSFAGSATISVDALSQYTTGPALVVGALTPSSTPGSIDINANLGAVSLSAGIYDLINYSGAIGGVGSSAFSLLSVTGTANGQNVYLANQGNQIDLVVTGNPCLWNGTGPDWQSTGAWTLNGAPETFQSGDTDVFDDTAGTANGGTYNGTVLLSTSNVAPASVTFNNNNLAYTLSGAYGIVGNAPLALTGSGTVTIANSNGYTGTTTIGPYATLQIGAGGNTGQLSPNSAIVDNGTLVFSRSDNIVQGTHFSSAGITGVGALTQLGPGMLTLTASNTYSGATTISGGTLQLGTGTSGQDGSINGTSGVTNNGTLVYNIAGNLTAGYAISGGGGLVNVGSGAVTLSGSISGGGSVAQAGPGTLTLSASNSYTGGTTLSAGTLVNSNIAGLGGYTAPVSISNGNNNVELRFVSSVQNSNNTATYMPITVTGGGTGSVTLSFNQGNAFTDASLNIGQAVTIRTIGTGTQSGLMGPITGSGAGPGSDSVIFSAPSGATLYYTAGWNGSSIIQNSFQGNVHFMGGGTIATQNVGYLNSSSVNGAIPGTASVTVDAGTTWMLNWGSQAIDGLNGGGIVDIQGTYTNTIQVLTIGANNGSGTFSGVLEGGGGLSQSGSGVEVLTGANTYTAGTNINSGTLQIGNGGSTGSLSASSSSSNTITDNGTLVFSRSNNIAQGSQFTPNPIIGSGGLVQLGPGTLTLNAQNSYTGPTVISGGVLNATNLGYEGSPSAIGQGSGSPNPADLVIDSGTLQYTGAGAQTSNWLFTVGRTGAATLNASGGPGGTLTLGVNGGALAFANSAAPATLTLTGSGAGSLGATIGDSGTGASITSLVKTGAGTWTLSGNNIYSGTTAVSAGTLTIAGVNAGTGPINVNAGALYITGSAATTTISVAGGATLGGTGATSAGANVANGGILDLSQNAGNTFSLGGLTFAGHATINVDALANYASNPVLSTGALTPSTTAGLVTIDANLGSLTVSSGTYDLISYTGAIGGSGLAGFNIAVNGIGSRQGAVLVSANNQIDVVVSGAAPYWSGNQPDWLSAGAWTLQPGGATTTFLTGDSDIFDNSASGPYGGMVLLNSGNVTPASVTFNNSYLSYSLSGAYGITGSAAVTIQGGGSVTIANSNGYTGGTFVTNNSTLDINSANAIGSGTLTLNGAVLDNTSGSPVTLATNNPQNWNGDFTFNGSNNLNLGTGAVTLGNSRNVTINAGMLTVGGAISDGGQGYSLTLNGNGTLLLTGSSNYAGTTTINGGTLQLGDGTPGHDGSINATAGVSDYGTLAYNLNGSQTASYAIGGFGNLVLNRGNLTLLGSNTYSGGTNINGGTLQIGDGATNGTFGTGQYDIAAGARLYLNYASAVSASNGWSQNISGSGAVELNAPQPAGTFNQWGPNNGSATVFTSAFGGTLQVDNGRIDSSPAGLGGTSNIIINNGAQFLAWIGTFNVPITIAGNGAGESGFPGALRASAAGNTVTWAAPITLSAAAGIESQGATTFKFTGPITGNYPLQFEGTSASGTFSVAPTGGSQNAYGSTEVDAYAVVVAGNQYAFSTGPLQMNGGILELNGSSFSFANLFGSAGTIGDYAATGSTITVGSDNSTTAYHGSVIDGGSGSLALDKVGGGILELSGNNTFTGGTTVSGGELIVSSPLAIDADGVGTNLSVGTDLGAFGTVIPAHADATPAASSSAVAPVPEPGTLALVAAAVGCAALYRRRRRR